MAVPAVASGTKGRPSSYLGRMLPPYTKPHLSFADQLALLMQRGLVVTDQPEAVLYLQRISYGRLTPYWQPLQQLVPDPNDAMRTIRTEQFQAGAEFRHAVDLYLFDNQLRLLFLDAIERTDRSRAARGSRACHGYAKGDRIFFYPRTGATYAGDGATRASAEFDELAGLEG